MTTQKYTYAQVKDVIETEGCKLLSDTYKNNKTKLQVQCHCGQLFSVRLNDFLSGNHRQCNQCARNAGGLKRMMPYGAAVSELKSRGLTMLDAAETYSGAHAKVNIRCGCGEVYQDCVYSIVYYNRRHCPMCADRQRGMRRRLPIADIQAVLEAEQYTVITTQQEYDQTYPKLQIRCNKGHQYETRYSTISVGGRCMACWYETMTLNQTTPEAEVIKYVTDAGYKVVQWLEPYKGYATKALVLCNKGHEYQTDLEFLKFKHSGCPVCQESKGERETRRILRKHGIPFETQVKLEGCVNKRLLPFDFAVYHDQLKQHLRFLIEFDGLQHFEPTGYDQDNLRFKRVQHTDRIKNEFCRANGITLIRIPYYDIENIEAILMQALKEAAASF